jgi:hypothetical protein
MPVSDAQHEANVRNAQLSTGPKTQEGKDRSRMNSLKHGLCSEVVRVPEDEAAHGARARSWINALKPQNMYHAWLIDEIAVLTLRIERCGRIDRRVRDLASIRAEESWDDDRRSIAEAIGIHLSSRPASVVDDLRRTPQGCDWLIDRWALLARASIRNKGPWNPDQKRLAFDLLGTPQELRDGEPGEVVDRRGEVVESAADPLVVARREVDALLARREMVSQADKFARSMVEADLVDEASPELARTRRYEASLNRRLRWCVAQVGFESPRHRANSDLVLHYFAPEAQAPATPEPAPVVEEAPAPGPIEPEPIPFWKHKPAHAPFELRPGESPTPDGFVDIPAILARRDSHLNRNEARRAARRRGRVRVKA